MEDEIKQEELETETDTGETSLESQEAELEESKETEEESEESENEAKDIDFKGELEKVTGKESRSEAEKAIFTLKKVAERVTELGQDPAEILKIKPKKEVQADTKTVVQSEIQRTFIERDVMALAKNDDHFKLMMHYVDNNKLSAQDAYVLSMKGTLLRKESEVKRSLIQFASPKMGSKKAVLTPTIPEHPQSDLLVKRGYSFDPKTKSYKGKFYEEYYDSTDKTWKSRKLQK